MSIDDWQANEVVVMDSEELKERTKDFAREVIRRLIGNQLFRAGTSVGANYRAACRGRSKADFISKIGITLEEADETLYWL